MIRVQLSLVLSLLAAAMLNCNANANDFEPFLKSCEKSISKHWQGQALEEYKIPDYFKQHAKGVVCFELDSKGQAKRITVKHSSRESLIVAAKLKYGAKGEALLDAMDKAMIASIKETSPFPPPPKEFVAHKRYAVVFDTERLKPLRIYVDDQIPVAQSNPYTW